MKTDRQNGVVLHGHEKTWIRCYPAPADTEALRVLKGNAAFLARVRSLRDRPEETLVVRVDRVDPAKNIVRGFQAFGLLLRENPRLRGKVHFLAHLVPSRSHVSEYRTYERQITDTVSNVLSEFPGSVTISQSYDRVSAMAALCVYDLLLVNPLADGMNLVAQEGPAINGVDGAVVISETAGSADLLRPNAISLKNPRSVRETKEAMAQALSLSLHERRRRASLMRGLVTSRTPGMWLVDQIRDLEAIQAKGEPTQDSSPLFD
jgi:trehalose 6-phosphate synthase